MRRKALVIGIDDYSGDLALEGGTRDAIEIGRRLEYNREDPTSERGTRNWEVRYLVDDAAQVPEDMRTTVVPVLITRDVLENELERHFTSRPDTHLVLFFAGHAMDRGGTQLIASDERGVTFSRVMELARNSRAATVTVLLDCCLAGGFGNQGDASRDPFGLDVVELPQGMTVLTAASTREDSMETEGADGVVHGAFTRLLLSALDGAARDIGGRITALDIYAHVAGAFRFGSQTPLLKAHVSAPTVLRTVAPRIAEDRLRQLPIIFPGTSAPEPLTLSMEHEGGTIDGVTHPGLTRGRNSGYVPFAGPSGEQTRAQTVLDYLKEWRDAGLVQGEKGEDFFFLCQHGGTVSLTDLGRYFWELARSRHF